MESRLRRSHRRGDGASRIAISLFSAITGLALAGTQAFARSKTDVVVLENGDTVTCEIKDLSVAKLTIKTDDMGTISVDWLHVRSISSSVDFELEMSHGERHFGNLAPGPEPGTVAVKGAEAEAVLRLSEVIRLTPIEATFIQRLDGSVDLGFNVLKANSQRDFDFSTDLTYTTRHERGTGTWEIDVDSTISERDGADTTRRNVLNVNRTFMLGSRWFSFGAGHVETNESLGLDLRWTAGGGFGRKIVSTNRNRFRAWSGLAYNNEQYVEEEAQTSTEALLAVDYQLFEYDEPEKSLTVMLAVIPSLTVSGRVRAQLDVDVRFEIIKDFFIGLSGWDSYDNKPPNTDLEKNDYGVSTTIGWTF
jgi:putative salt-induced outer membrane protein YdiY